MNRVNVVRAFQMIVVGVALVVMTGPSAFAGLFGCRYVCRPRTVYVYYQPSVDLATVRQVRVIYFSAKYNAWFETDAVVPPAGASIGLSTVVSVPHVGLVRGWVVAVFSQPRMNSPYSEELREAKRIGNAVGAGLGTQGSLWPPTMAPLPAAAAQATPSVAPTQVAIVTHPVSPAGICVRLWTNKAGTAQAVAELLEVRDGAIVVRNSAGKVYEQPFDSLSDTDVAFVQTLAVNLHNS